MSISLVSNAKLNLALSINYKRSDGYHDISSIMQEIDLSNLDLGDPAKLLKSMMSGNIKDNKGLNYAIKNSDIVLPIFIFTPEQIGKQNDFRSNNAIQFMIESLKDVDTRSKGMGSKVHLFQGENNKVIKTVPIET